MNRPYSDSEDFISKNRVLEIWGLRIDSEGDMTGSRAQFRLALLIIVTGAFLAPGASPAAGQSYPSKPITLIIPYPPGGSTDLTARPLAMGTKKYLGQTVVGENKPGGGGTVGVALVVSKPADGYSIGVFTGSTLQAYQMGKLNFHPLNDLTPIMRWGDYLYGILVRTDSQWKTIQDLIQYAKKNPDKLSYGTPGTGSSGHLGIEELSMAAGIRLVHVPYKGGAEINTALLGGHIDVLSNSSGWTPMVDAGKFRLLAVYGEQRTPRYPQAPTLREVGYDVVVSNHMGIVGPKGLPKPIVTRLHEAFKKAMDDPAFIEAQKKFEITRCYSSPEEYEKYLREEFERMGKLVKRLGLDKT
jgi:tripartite-type tricarboxylate transporter receptor subunit TctC